MELINNAIYYFGDPMCSWCYGVSQEVQKLKDTYQDRFKFEMVMGGLRPFENQPMNKYYKRELKKSWDMVHERTGVIFNEKILAPDYHFVYNTEKACRAVVAFKAISQTPQHHFNFLKDIQNAFYQEGMDPHTVENYQPLVEKYQLSFEEFKEVFESDEIRRRTNEDFQISKQIGVKGFPTICFASLGEIHALATGYSTFELMQEILEKILSTSASLN